MHNSWCPSYGLFSSCLISVLSSMLQTHTQVPECTCGLSSIPCTCSPCSSETMQKKKDINATTVRPSLPNVFSLKRKKEGKAMLEQGWVFTFDLWSVSFRVEFTFCFLFNGLVCESSWSTQMQVSLIHLNGSSSLHHIPTSAPFHPSVVLIELFALILFCIYVNVDLSWLWFFSFLLNWEQL